MAKIEKWLKKMSIINDREVKYLFTDWALSTLEKLE